MERKGQEKKRKEKEKKIKEHTRDDVYDLFTTVSRKISRKRIAKIE